jgi:hypothetical protein
VRLEGEASDDEDAAAMAEQEDNEAEAEPAAGSSSSSSKLSLSASTGGRSNMQRLAICTAVGEVDFYLYDVDAQQVIGTFSGHRATVTTVKRDSDLVVPHALFARVSCYTTHTCADWLGGWGVSAERKRRQDDSRVGFGYAQVPAHLQRGRHRLRHPPLRKQARGRRHRYHTHTPPHTHTHTHTHAVQLMMLCAGAGEQSSFLRVWDYVKRTHMMDIPVSRVPRRIFSITVLPDRIYCSTNEHITVVDFRDVEGVEVMCKPKKSTRSRRGRENCLLQ